MRATLLSVLLLVFCGSLWGYNLREIFKGQPADSITNGGPTGCDSGKRLVFDLNATLEETKRHNRRDSDCPTPDPSEPCFHYEDVLYPVFVIEDMDSGKTDRFLGSYTFKIVGGGSSRSNIRLYSQEEILKYNSLTYSVSQKTLVWKYEETAAPVDLTDGGFVLVEHSHDNDSVSHEVHDWKYEDKAAPVDLTDEGFAVMNGSSYGVGWFCQRKSPCGDLFPQNFQDPGFFFVIEVSSEETDRNTTCVQPVRFVLHVRGFPLNPFRALLYMMISISIFLSVKVCYTLYYWCGPGRKTTCGEDQSDIEQVYHASVWEEFKAGGLSVRTRRKVATQYLNIVSSFINEPMFGYFILLVIHIDADLLVFRTFISGGARQCWILSAIVPVLTGIYLMEVVLKLLVMGNKYFICLWNDLDLVIVLMSVVELSVEILVFEGHMSTKQATESLGPLKGAHAVRLLKALRVFRGNQRITSTFTQSLRSLSSILLFFLIFWFGFALLFRNIFETLQPEIFGHMFGSIFTLFAITTFDDWHLIYGSLRDRTGAYIMIPMAIFIIIENYTFLNLLTSVLMDNFHHIKIKKRTSKHKKVESTVNEEDKGKIQSLKKAEQEMSEAPTEEAVYEEAPGPSESEIMQRKRIRLGHLLIFGEQLQQRQRAADCLQQELMKVFFKGMVEDSKKDMARVKN